MAVALDAHVSTNNSSSATITMSLTIAAGASLLIVEVSCRGISTNPGPFGISGITAGGVAMTRAYTSPDYSSAAGVEAYELVNPPTGAGVSIVATRIGAGSAPVILVAKSYTGTDTTTPTSGWTRVTANSANSSPYTKTQAITTTTGDLTTSFINAASNFSAVATSAGFQTETDTNTDSNSTETRSGYLAGNGSVTHSYDLTADASGRIAYVLYTNILQAAGGGGGAVGAGTLAKMAGRRGKQLKRMAA